MESASTRVTIVLRRAQARGKGGWARLFDSRQGLRRSGKSAETTTLRAPPTYDRTRIFTPLMHTSPPQLALLWEGGGRNRCSGGAPRVVNDH